MLRKKFRLSRGVKFPSRGFKAGAFILKYLPNGLEISRFGAVVGRKVFKNAVLRNKIRRRIYDIVGNNLKRIRTGFDVLITVLPPAAAFSPNEFREKLNEALDKL